MWWWRGAARVIFWWSGSCQRCGGAEAICGVELRQSDGVGLHVLMFQSNRPDDKLSDVRHCVAHIDVPIEPTNVVELS